MPAERIAAVLILVYIAMQTTHATVSALESGDVMKHKLLEIRNTNNVLSDTLHGKLPLPLAKKEFTAETVNLEAKQSQTETKIAEKADEIRDIKRSSGDALLPDTKDQSSEERRRWIIADGIKYLLAPPSITVYTVLHFNDLRESHPINVPLFPHMSAIDALVYAAKRFAENTRVDDNPYNAAFRWNSEQYCYMMTKLLGLENGPTHTWTIVVRSSDGQIKYYDHCLPFEEELILRPYDQLILYYAFHEVATIAHSTTTTHQLS